jgi:hypothetical protein
MRISLLAIFLLLSAMVSCKKEDKPQGILSKAQMADWMIDVYLAEARTQMLGVPMDSAFRIFLPYQDSIMRKKGLQDSVLRKSYQYYLANTTELESIYDIVIDSLSLREQRLRQAPVIPFKP